MKLYGAIDLHSTNNVMVVINEQDQVVCQKRLPNDLSLIAQHWCGPTVRHSLIENKGASIRDHIPRGLKKGIRKLLTVTSVPLDLPANGRPDTNRKNC